MKRSPRLTEDLQGAVEKDLRGRVPILAGIDRKLIQRVVQNLGSICCFHRPTLHRIVIQSNRSAVSVVPESADVLGTMIKQRNSVGGLGRLKQRSDCDDPQREEDLPNPHAPALRRLHPSMQRLADSRLHGSR